jgi:hypothetical protein
MAYDAIPKNARDAVITLKDGTGSPITFEIKYEPGDFKAGPFIQGGKEVVSIYDRGDRITERKTKALHPAFSFSCWVTAFSHATDGSPLDAVLKQGKFSAGVSTNGTSADVWTFDITFVIEGTNIGSATDNTLTLEDCHATIEIAEGEEVNTWTINGICKGAWTFA